MRDPLEIDFIVAGGPRLGLGHIMRSAAIAEAAIARGYRIRVFLSADGLGNTQIDSNSPAALAAWKIASPRTEPSRIQPWSRYPAGRRAAVGVLDYPGEKGPWIIQLAENRTRSIALDDRRSIHRADLTINPALHHNPTVSPSRKRSEEHHSLLEGPAYSILAQAHRSTPYRIFADRINFLLSLGGADPHQATPKLAPWITEALATLESKAEPSAPPLCRHVVLGSAFKDPLNRTRDALRATGWTVHSALPPEKMAELMASARIAVIGFGTSLTELAWHGTPHLSVTHHRFDDQYAKGLEGSGVGRHLGFAGDLKHDRTMATLAESLGDTEWQCASAERARAMLQGGTGVERILDEVERLTRTTVEKEIQPVPRSLEATPQA